MIDSYTFGRIVVNGKTYTNDVIVYPQFVDGRWWRKEGHRLCIDDIRSIVDRRPEVLVIGTGHSGLMKVLPETKEYVESKGIELVAQKTTEACDTYNRLLKSKRVVAALHLTC
ncbi:MAG: Mth938-like domain-containing protein [Candidatus Bathyarchaeia archaeon]